MKPASADAVADQYSDQYVRMEANNFQPVVECIASLLKSGQQNLSLSQHGSAAVLSTLQQKVVDLASLFKP